MRAKTGSTLVPDEYGFVGQAVVERFERLSDLIDTEPVTDQRFDGDLVFGHKLDDVVPYGPGKIPSSDQRELLVDHMLAWIDLNCLRLTDERDTTELCSDVEGTRLSPGRAGHRRMGRP